MVIWSKATIFGVASEVKRLEAGPRRRLSARARL